jgi:hypothetical protein
MIFASDLQSRQSQTYHEMGAQIHGFLRGDCHGLMGETELPRLETWFFLISKISIQAKKDEID